MVNKKGDYKYGIILSLILGVMVLSLSLYFIFQELWSSDELDWEICRQSIQIRALAPEYNEKWTSTTPISFKNEYPLKCKTQIIEIDKSDVKNINKIIGDTMAKCWALFDKGDSIAFPSSWYGSTSACVPCVRIHLTENAKKELEKEKIDIRVALDDRMTEEYSYWQYLNNSGKTFPAFNPESTGEFDFSEEVFRVNSKETKTIWGWFGNTEISNVYLPKYFDIEEGDLLINYGVVVSGGAYTPYLFYFQQGQTSPSPFEEVKNQFYSWKGIERVVEISDANFCEQWEGIPA